MDKIAQPQPWQDRLALEAVESQLVGAVVAVAATSLTSFERLTEECLAAAGGARMHSVLALGIADGPCLLSTYFAPMTGMVRLDSMRAEALGRAEQLARRAALGMPPTVAVQHCACRGWTDPCVGATLARHGCQALIADAGELSGRRRRKVRALAAELGIDLTLVP
jgi:hypothetical protein